MQKKSDSVPEITGWWKLNKTKDNKYENKK
jgi:hypothetical protein